MTREYTNRDVSEEFGKCVREVEGLGLGLVCYMLISQTINISLEPIDATVGYLKGIIILTVS